LLCPSRSSRRRALRDRVSLNNTRTARPRPTPNFLVSDRSCPKTDGLRPHQCDKIQFVKIVAGCGGTVIALSDFFAVVVDSPLKIMVSFQVNATYRWWDEANRRPAWTCSAVRWSNTTWRSWRRPTEIVRWRRTPPPFERSLPPQEHNAKEIRYFVL